MLLDGAAVGCPVGYEVGDISQYLLSTVGQVETHCCSSVSTKAFRRIQTAEVEVDEQVLYVASNCQLLQESQLEAPGPEKSPLAQAVHTLAPAPL